MFAPESIASAQRTVETASLIITTRLLNASTNHSFAQITGGDVQERVKPPFSVPGSHAVISSISSPQKASYKFGPNSLPDLLDTFSEPLEITVGSPSSTPMPKLQDPTAPLMSATTLTESSSSTKTKNLGAHEAILQPVQTFMLPEPEEDALLFEGDEKLWYLGFVKHWADFQSITTQFYNTELIKKAFDEVKDHSMDSPSDSDVEIAKGKPGSDLLTEYVQRELLETVEKVYNKLLGTTVMKEVGVPQSVFLGKATSQDQGSEESKGSPAYVVRTKTLDGDDPIKLMGQVEYLGGRPEAFTWAIKEQVQNTWGSLRCLLGERQLSSSAVPPFTGD